MHIRSLSIAAAVAACALSTSTFAADGEINFVGSINANTCPVVVEDLNGGGTDVRLGNVTKGSLQKQGDIGGGAAFMLRVDTEADDCNVTGGARVTFLPLSGTVGEGRWLGLSASASPATNIGVQIRDFTGAPVELGLRSATYADVTKPMRFTANYIATGPATEGEANAKAAFSIDYD